MQGMMIAGTHSGCGKTTVTLGVTAALVARGIPVQSFKAGPDFIDAGLHRLASGCTSINLDLWMCGDEGVLSSFCRYAPMGDIAVVEGVMGIFDGAQGSAALAGMLGLPVILIVDAFGMAESAGALVQGFTSWAANSGISLVGIIFNRVGSEIHYRRLLRAVSGVEVLGYLPRNSEAEIPSRHLGLATADEVPMTRMQVEALAALAEKHIAVDRLIALSEMQTEPCQRILGRGGRIPVTVRIAIARDVAFSFYYEENLDLLREAGAEIVPFSPLWDSELPADVHALYVGGGYPELHAELLSANESMRSSMQEFIASGRPAYAECGGLMYLSRGINDLEGRFFPMVSALPFETCMRKQRVRLGYREITFNSDCILGRAGGTIRGHEFHYSEISSDMSGLNTVYAVADAQNAELSPEGFSIGSLLASYIHMHFGSNPRTARNFVNFIKENVWKR
ncbi:MAG TPA: cobyrinate a,c-diamide synthase [Dissulfurispiraceae bacterium]|nr:cobyrinate a,c-diamide synthase [Dissulfurispiraceae bacterium]